MQPQPGHNTTSARHVAEPIMGQRQTLGIRAMSDPKQESILHGDAVANLKCRISMRPFLFSRATLSSSGRGSSRVPMDDSDGQSRNILSVKTFGWSLQPLQIF